MEHPPWVRYLRVTESLQDRPRNRPTFEFHSEAVAVVLQALAINNFAEYRLIVYWSNPYLVAGLPTVFGEYARAEWTNVICIGPFLPVRIRGCLGNQANPTIIGKRFSILPLKGEAEISPARISSGNMDPLRRSFCLRTFMGPLRLERFEPGGRMLRGADVVQSNRNMRTKIASSSFHSITHPMRLSDNQVNT